ncbi:TPA: hypothetical protein N0F65_012104 [Lagenidium giganteum]|uniref:Leucine-rich repeat domain, L domain-like n=1 Tax=Lagenidium giganteum TaxID=4803 RepID=A0AAV2YUT1_9STRA|nr:TPA: hypothetical protein N0F65_012104 [Lagenidium giganteum]
MTVLAWQENTVKPIVRGQHHTAHATDDSPDEVVALELSLVTFRRFWIVMLVSQALFGTFLAALGRLYFLAHPYMQYYADLLVVDSTFMFRAIGMIFFLVALAHWWQAGKMVYWSIRCRTWVFKAPRRFRSARSAKSSNLVARSSPHRLIRTAWNACFDRQGFFGVESPFFDVRFAVREVIEIVSQTVQIYNASVLIGKPWINHLYVALIVVNCMSTPLIKHCTEHAPALERVMCLAVDVVLDTGTCIIVPLIILWPYIQQFDMEIYSFPLALVYDDVWFINMVMENQQVFALGLANFAFKFVPFLSIYSCLNSITDLIKPRRPGDKASTRSRTQAWRPSRRLMLPELSARTVSIVQRTERMTKHGLKGARGVVIHVLLIVWGLGILGLHLNAMHRSLALDVPDCKQRLRPWFANKFACSVFEFNCYRNGSTGINDGDLLYLDEDSVAAFVFLHCPALTVPRDLRHFTKLLGFEIYNSTIVEWSADAAISSDTHPLITYVIMALVNLTRLPDGILQPLPDPLLDIEIAYTNLTTLPLDLSEHWHPLAILYYEHSYVTEFPAALVNFSVDELSVLGNKITHLPDLPYAYVTLSLSHNPLKELPDQLGEVGTLAFLYVEDTQLTAFPSWIDDVIATASHIYALETPFCRNKTAQEIAANCGNDSVLTCTTTTDRYYGRYPLEIVAPHRQL